MTFDLWNRKSLWDGSKPLAAPVSKSTWSSLKGKLYPRRNQQPPDTRPPVHTKDSHKDRPREPRSGAVSSSVPIAPVPRSTGWPSRLRYKAARGLHLHGKLSSKNETTEQSTPRPLSSESWPEWDPDFYASTMEADRRAVAERMKAAATIRKEKPPRGEADDEDLKVILPPLPPPMTQKAGDVNKGYETTSARPPAPPGTTNPLNAPSKSLDGPPKNVGSGTFSHRQIAQPSLRAGSSTPPGKGATHRATPKPTPYIVIEEATPKSVRTRRPDCVYQPPGFPALRFDTDGRGGVAEKNQGVSPRKEEPEPASDRAESPEVFLPPLPTPLRPPMPCNVVNDAERTSTHSPARLRTPKSSNVSPTPKAGGVVSVPSTTSARPPLPPGKPDSLESPSKSSEGPFKNVGSGNPSHRQTSQPSPRTGSCTTPPGKGARPRATPDPIPYIVIEEATPKSVRTRRPECVYQPPGFPALRFDADGRRVPEKNQSITPKKEEPEPASDRAESPEVFLPPLPAPLRPPMPRSVVKNTERTPMHSPTGRRTPKSSNVSPTPNAGDVVKGAETTSTRPPAPPSTVNSLKASSKSLGGPLENVGTGNSSHRESFQPSPRTGSSIPPGKGASPRATPDPIPYIVIEEATPKSARTRRPECVYQPSGLPALRFDADGRRVAEKNQSITPKKEEPEPASDRAESPEVFLPPLPAPLRPSMPRNVVKNTERTPVHSPTRRRTPKSSNGSPTPSAVKTEETESTSSRAPPSGRVHPSSLPGLELKSGKFSKASPTMDTNPSCLLERENVSIRSPASDVPPGNHDPNDVDKGFESSRSGQSDRSDETPRASMIGFPKEHAAAGVHRPSMIETNPSGLFERENVSVRSVAREVPPGPNDGDEGYESSRSGDSERSDDTIRASKVGLPGGPGAAAVQQPTPGAYLRPPIVPSRRSRKPERAPPHRVPAVSETDREREPTVHSNGSTSRQVGLSAKVIWARQLQYRLDLWHSVGDRVKYALAAQEALKAGFVICPKHVLRRASAIIPIDAAFLPVDSPFLANSSSSC